MKLKVRLLCIGIFLSSLLFRVNAQNNIVVTGKVTNKTSGLALEGVSVVNEKTHKSTQTNESGSFTISVEKGATLTFSYVGMSPYKYKVNAAEAIAIQMDEEIKKNDEVIVVGYGTQKVTKVSGAISTVKSADIEKLKPVRAEDALQGRAAGVNVISSGSPGGKPTVFVRGIPSYKGSDPLVVVDGAVETLDDLNSINSADIESINVLKDAATTAIYGVKGGNGVILVTTKSGRKNKKAEFNYSSNYGIQEVARKLPVLNATEYAAIVNEGRLVDGNSIAFTDLSKLGVGTNWQNQIFKSSPMQSHSITARGGAENITYFVSGAYTGQDGIVGGGDKSYFNRYNATSNLSIDLTSKLKLLSNISFVNIRGASVPENAINSVISNAINFDPTAPIYNNVPGTVGDFSVSKNIISEIVNPLTQLANVFNKSNTNKLYGKIELQYNLLKNLKITSRYGFTNVDISNKSFSPLIYYGSNHTSSTLKADGTSNGTGHNAVSYDKDTYYNYTLETFGNYTFKVAKEHSFDVLVGISAAKNTGNVVSASRQDVPNNSWNWADFTAATGNASNGGVGGGEYRFEKRNISYFSRVNYDYQEKYLASFSLRRDGSYEFGANNKFGTFYAGSLGWLVSSESFYKFKAIDYLKIRGSYGVTGNDNIDHPQYLQIYTGIYEYGKGNNTGYVFNGSPVNGSTLSTFANPDLKWEQQKQFNFGFDARLIKNRLSLTVDYFERNISGLLFTPQLSMYLGTSAAPFANVGTTQTKGLDLSVGYTQPISKDLKLSSNVTFTTAKNLVTETSSGYIQGGTYGIPTSYSVTRYEKGRAPGYFYGYKAIGIFQTQEEIAKNPTQSNAQPGDIRFADINGDGKISDSDRTMIGNPFPKFTIGWNISLEYKSFDFNVYIYSSSGNDIYRAYERNLAFTNKYRGILSRWTGAGTTNDPKSPRVTFADPNINTRASDRYIEDGSFIKIKDIQLGYTVPATLYKSKIFNKIRLYMQVKNALVLTKYSGLDPEIAGGIFDTGVDRGNYPQARIYSMGIDCKF